MVWWKYKNHPPKYKTALLKCKNSGQKHKNRCPECKMEGFFPENCKKYGKNTRLNRKKAALEGKIAGRDWK